MNPITNIMTSSIASLVLITNYISRLILAPYATMRKIAREKDYMQILILFVFIYAYFVYANVIRAQTLHPFIISKSSLASFIMFIITFILSTSFFYVLGKTLSIKTVEFKKLMFLFAYSMIPTLLWFIATSTLFLILPPPSTISFLGQLFSFVFTAYSITLLLWRFILLYLSIRFTFKTQFFATMGLIALYFVWFIPYSYMMYQLKIFRIPFI